VPRLSPIRVAPGARYFETADGSPFLFIGPNDSLTWPGLAGLYRRRDVDAVDAYLADLAANGVTILRLMLEYAEGEEYYFERSTQGQELTPEPDIVQVWDDLFARCETHGLRILLAPWDNFWMARLWHRHPYNRIHGGPADTPSDFFTNEAVIAATIRRLQFVVKRWGDSGALAAWDLFNEIHPHWGGTAQQQSDVIARISNALREVEQATWESTRPQTVSIFGPQPAPEYEELIFRHPCLDFVSTHIYHAEAIDYPRDTVRPALSMAHWVRYALERMPSDRPYLDSEHGPIHLFNDHGEYLPEAFDEEYERHLMWAHLASGGAGTGMRWPARHPHLTTTGMRRDYQCLARFARQVDWRPFTPRDARADICLSLPGLPDLPEIHSFAIHDGTQAVAYLLREGAQGGSNGMLPSSREPLGRLWLTLRGLTPGRCVVHVWEPCTRRFLFDAECIIGNDAELTMNLPPIQADLALAVTRSQVTYIANPISR